MTPGVMTVGSVADLAPSDRGELRDLSSAVNGPASAIDWPGRALEWSSAEWCVQARDAHGRLVSVTGIVLRQGTYGGRPLRIGGIGGVKTHPQARRQGHAARTLTRAVDFLHTQIGVAFALLVCDPQLIPYYARLGWRVFHGRLLIRNAGAVVEFDLARVMTLDIESAAPVQGTIDICGPPW